MLFFQVLLVGGYGYAHWLTRNLRPRQQAFIHGLLLLSTLVFLPIIPADDWKPAPGSEPTTRILLLLLATVGLPYLVVSTTGPLLQRWFSLLYPTTSPYRLYALSNIGSLLALVSYPFFVEPHLTRRLQAISWSVGMMLFVVACLYCAWMLARSHKDSTVAQEQAAEDADNSPPPSRGRKLLWLALPASASALLLATTNKISQDVAVIPFLWVLPLSLYLLSFIICFDNPRWYSRLWYGVALVPSIAGVCWVMFLENEASIIWQVVAFAGSMFLCCMVCHGELYSLKPTPKHLTGYYLMISVGGALGGVFVAVIAPLFFKDYYEYHVALMLCWALAVAVYVTDRASKAWRGGPWWLCGTFTVATVALAVTLVAETTYGTSKVITRKRNFYGVLAVYEYYKDDPTAHHYLLQHGRITHGLQFTEDLAARWPTSYYGEQTGIGLALRHFPRQENRRIGLVGLGTGTLAVYGKTGDYLRIYDINPDVLEIARNPFTHLRDCLASHDVILGDARLSMEFEPPQQFDILALDAFSSDAIPVHLLTKESFELYLRHIKPDGVIAVHISNRLLNLEPVLLSLSKEFGLKYAMVEHSEEDEKWWMYSTTWVLLTR
ncbi:MAG: fused MFS/spermidine synthase, partial [Verrucomicrobiota bacterium]